jgi:hypothetical protein
MLNAFEYPIQLEARSDQAPAMIHHMMIIKTRQGRTRDGLQRLPG